jgi:hypothetical protein
METARRIVIFDQPETSMASSRLRNCALGSSCNFIVLDLYSALTSQV